MSDDLNRDAYKLFSRFSRLEYALKASVYYKTDDKKFVKTDWNKFILKNKDKLQKCISEESVAQSVNIILEKPPKKQRLCDGKIEWVHVDASQGSDLKNLICYIRRIRNNLFHGGKFFDNWNAGGRAHNLIKAANCIINSIVKVDPDVQKNMLNTAKRTINQSHAARAFAPGSNTSTRGRVFLSATSTEFCGMAFHAARLAS